MATQGYWQVTMENIKDNGKTLLKNLDAVIDTGTSIVIGEPFQVSNMYKALGGKPVPGDGNQGFYSCKSWCLFSSCDSIYIL